MARTNQKAMSAGSLPLMLKVIEFPDGVLWLLHIVLAPEICCIFPRVQEGNRSPK